MIEWQRGRRCDRPGRRNECISIKWNSGKQRRWSTKKVGQLVWTVAKRNSYLTSIGEKLGNVLSWRWRREAFLNAELEIKGQLFAFEVKQNEIRVVFGDRIKRKHDSGKSLCDRSLHVNDLIFASIRLRSSVESDADNRIAVSKVVSIEGYDCDESLQNEKGGKRRGCSSVAERMQQIRKSSETKGKSSTQFGIPIIWNWHNFRPLLTQSRFE